MSRYHHHGGWASPLFLVMFIVIGFLNRVMYRFFYRRLGILWQARIATGIAWIVLLDGIIRLTSLLG